MAPQPTNIFNLPGVGMLRGKAVFGWLEPGVLVLMVLFVPLLLVSNPRIAATDEAQYYVYLTSLRFDGDLNFANDYARLAELNPKSGIDNLLDASRIREKTGLYGNIAPIGSALLWAPFFLAADLFVHIANLFGARIAADGFSAPYIRAVCYGSAVYGLIGIMLCYQIARRYTSQFAASLSTAVIWLSTPLVFYMFVQMAFSHANGFFLVALFVWLWLRGQGPEARKQTPSPGRYRRWLALGVVGGLMTITREQLGLFLLLPALEAVGAYIGLMRGRGGTVTARQTMDDGRPTTFIALFTRHLLFLVVFLCMLTPQLATYQVLNGSPRPASEVGGKFNLCSPHMIDTLIDSNPAPSAWCRVVDDPAVNFPAFAHGAFVWSPVLPLALLGLVLLWRRTRWLALAFGVAFLAQTYLNGAFGTTWHLTGSFGFRRLIECSPIFILGLALVIDWATQRIDWRLLVAFGIVFILWNFGLIANWTVLQPELRRGLKWPELWSWQFEAPLKLLGRIRALLFDRCSLMQNGCR